MLTEEQIIRDIAEMEKEYNESLDKYVAMIGRPVIAESKIHWYNVTYLGTQIGTLKRVLIGVPYNKSLQANTNPGSDSTESGQQS